MEEIQVYGPFISRKQAKEQGLKHYFTGKRCKNGHITLRRVSDYKCIKCDVINSFKWKRDNPEKVKKWKKDNPEKVKASLKKSSAKFRAKSPEKAREHTRKRFTNGLKITLNFLL